MSQWFSKNDININNIIEMNDLHGYVLPHASTKYTKSVINNTLQFKPTKYFNNIIIIYYPVSDTENVSFNGKFYYHEFFVIYKIFKYVLEYVWNIPISSVNIIGLNIRDKDNKVKLDNQSLYVVSADFSHFQDMYKILEVENCAAHSIMFRNLNSPKKCIDVIDSSLSFKKLYKIIPKNYILQWVGRSRSPGLKGVGYLSFLLRDDTFIKNPNGVFVTAYDSMMRSRECLGNTNNWSFNIEKQLISNVLKLASTTSRLTNGKYLKSPIKHYSITYLYNTSKNTKFIRGYHAVMKGSLYLPDVFLENTYENGTWIDSNDTEWNHKYSQVFNMDETISKLNHKYSETNEKQNNNKIKLFGTKVKFVTL